METKILLTEDSFTNLCKAGLFRFRTDSGTEEVRLTKLDIQTLLTLGDDVFTKKLIGNKHTLLFKMGIDKELALEIVKRSPLYSDLYYNA
jgi:hypothetical protein